jgi:small-conductance mechanosensitive channel
VITPIDFSRLQQALASPRGWLEVAVALLCVAVGWLVDRRIEQMRERRATPARPPSRFPGIAFPLVALLLLYVATAAWRRYVGVPFFLAIAMPILIALAVIRVLAYGLRRLFPTQAWLPAWELVIGTAIWGLAILYFLGVLPEIASALDEVVVPLGKTQVSVLTILTGIGVVVVTLVVTLWLSGMIEHRLALASHLDANLRVVLGKFIRAVLIAVGVLISLQQIGFDLTLLSVFGGALGVGIGLGLQKLASNYIAGFTILLDRSVRIGDIITVDGRTGVVSQATSRYVVVRSGDGLEAIVPNETLVTTTVMNHSYTSHELRIALAVQVSYGSDVEKALEVLLDVAQREPRVLREGARAPQALVTSLGDNGMALELGVWIDDPRVNQPDLKSTLLRAILRDFAANGIEIPFPRRDVRFTGAIPAESGAVPKGSAQADPPTPPACPDRSF